MTKTKNKFLRIASSLLILVLLSTCFISGTFAKYTTSDSDSDTARVAKWGVVITTFAGETTDGTAFSQTYAKTDSSFTESENTVATNTNIDLVAPGTGGTLATVSVTGTPEVAVNMVYNINFELGDNWVVDTNVYYCPLKITVGSTVLNGMSYTSVTDFEEAVEDAIAVALVQGLTETTDGLYEKDYMPNVALNANVSVSWEWEFEAEYVYNPVTDDSAPAWAADTYYSQSGENYYIAEEEPSDWSSTYTNYYTRVALNDNERDTKLANMENAPEVEFEISVTATQID